MLAIDLSTTSAEIIEAEKSLLGKLTVKQANRLELSSGERWEDRLINFVKDKELSFTLPDANVFVFRLGIQAAVAGEALASTILGKVREIIPASLDDLVYDFSIVNKPEGGPQDILFIAATKEVLIPYSKAWQSMGARPVLAVPESLASFEILKGQIEPEEIVLFADIGAKISTLAFFDQFGPALTLSEPVETKRLEAETKKAIAFFAEKHARSVKRVILGGGGSLELDPSQFQEIVGLSTNKADQIFQDKLTKLEIEFDTGGFSPIIFLNALGLSLLAFEKETPNLAKKETIAQLAPKSPAKEEKKEEEPKETAS